MSCNRSVVPGPAPTHAPLEPEQAPPGAAQRVVSATRSQPRGLGAQQRLSTKQRTIRENLAREPAANDTSPRSRAHAMHVPLPAHIFAPARSCTARIDARQKTRPTSWGERPLASRQNTCPARINPDPPNCPILHRPRVASNPLARLPPESSLPVTPHSPRFPAVASSRSDAADATGAGKGGSSGDDRGMPAGGNRRGKRQRIRWPVLMWRHSSDPPRTWMQPRTRPRR